MKITLTSRHTYVPTCLILTLAQTFLVFGLPTFEWSEIAFIFFPSLYSDSDSISRSKFRMAHHPVPHYYRVVYSSQILLLMILHLLLVLIMNVIKRKAIYELRFTHWRHTSSYWEQFCLSYEDKTLPTLKECAYCKHHSQIVNFWTSWTVLNPEYNNSLGSKASNKWSQNAIFFVIYFFLEIKNNCDEIYRCCSNANNPRREQKP